MKSGRSDHASGGYLKPTGLLQRLAGASVGHRKAALALLAGGLLLIVGTFMAFATIPGVNESVSAIAAGESPNYLLAGGFAILSALMMSFGRSPARKVMGILTLLVIGFFGLFGAVTDIRSITDLPGTGDLDVHTGIGLYLLLAGSIVAVIGAVLGLGSGTAPLDPASPAP